MLHILTKSCASFSTKYSNKYLVFIQIEKLNEYFGWIHEFINIWMWYCLKTLAQNQVQSKVFSSLSTTHKMTLKFKIFYLCSIGNRVLFKSFWKIFLLFAEDSLGDFIERKIRIIHFFRDSIFAQFTPHSSKMINTQWWMLCILIEK